MRLELADGTVTNITNIKDVYNKIDLLDKKNDHLILGDDSYIQIAFLGHNLYETEYRDASGYFQARDQDQELSLLKEMFEGFLNGTSDWKKLTSWELIEDDNEGSSSSNYSSTTGSPGDFKDNLVDGLKRDAINWGKRKLRKFVKF